MRLLESEPEGAPVTDGPVHRRLAPAILTICAAVLLGGSLLFVGGAHARRLLELVAAVTAAAVLAPLPRALAARVPRRLQEALPPLAIVALCLYLHPYLARLDAPVSHDHPLHVFKAWATWDLLLRGQLLGWSDALDSGLPLGILYPPGAAYLTCAVRVLSLGLAGWVVCHAAVVLASVVATPLGIYALARGPLGRIPALVAGGLSAVEVGGWYQGGANFTLGWGVHAPALAVGLALLSLAALLRFARTGGGGSGTAAALAGAGAIVVHPLALLVLAIVGAAFAAQRALLPAQGDVPGRAPVRILAGLGIAVGLSAFWLVPFAAYGGTYGTPLGKEWLPLARAVTGLLQGGTLDGVAPALSGLGLAGLLLAALAGNRFAAGAAAALGVTLVVASDEALGALGLARLLPALESLQMERFSYLVKPLLWIGVAAGLAAARERMPAATVARRAGAGFLAGLLLAPIASALWSSAGAPIAPRLAEPPLVSTDPVQRDVEAAAAFLGRENATGRVLLVASAHHDHRLASLAVTPGLPVARLSYAAAELFVHLGTRLDPAVLELQGVRWVVSRRALEAPYLVRRAAYGGLQVHEVAGPAPSRVRISGGGAAAVERFTAGHVRVRVQGTAPGSTLTVGVAPFPGWSARQDGLPVAWDVERVSGLSFLRVPARDGVIELRFTPGAPVWVGLAVSMLVAALLAGALLRPGALRRIEAHGRTVIVVVLLATGLVAAALAVRVAFPGRWDLRERLEQITVSSPGVPCRRAAGSWGHRCGGRPAVQRALLTHRLETRKCVLVRADRGLTLTAPGVEVGRALVARLSIADGGSGEAQLTLEAGGRSAQGSVGGARSTTVRLDTADLRGREETVRLAIQGNAAPLCLQAHVE